MSRIDKRLQLNYPATVLADPGTQWERIYFLTTANISSRGAMFLSKADLSEGTPVQVFFYFEFSPSQNILRAKFSGKVVRSEPGGFTVAFDGVHTLRIRQPLKKLQKRRISLEEIANDVATVINKLAEMKPALQRRHPGHLGITGEGKTK
jgi:hypothetical protein